MNKVTKRYKRLNIALRILSVILLLAPIIIFSIIGFIEGQVHEKLVLGCTLITALILVLINAIFKYNIRSTLWICILGIYMCLDNIMPLLLIIAISTIIDEFIVTPLQKKYKNLYVINNEIDKR